MRRLVVSTVVLLAIVLAVDRVAAVVAGRVIADQLRVAGSLTSTPEVSVRGFPFLTQAVEGRYERIDLSAKGLRRTGLSFASLDIAVSGARVPLSDALGGAITAVPVEGLRATAVVDYAEVVGRSGVRGIRVTPVEDGVQVSGTVTVLGQTVTGSTRSTVRLSGGDIVVAARSVDVEGRSSALLDRAVSELLSFRIDLAVLPYGLRTTGVSATAAGLAISARTGPTVLQRP